MDATGSQSPRLVSNLTSAATDVSRTVESSVTYQRALSPLFGPLSRGYACLPVKKVTREIIVKAAEARSRRSTGWVEGRERGREKEERNDRLFTFDGLRWTD